MMTVRLRLMGMLARWFLTGRKRPDEPISRLPMRCWVSDCDINRHMNNSRYLALMDLGRYDLTLKSGLWRLVLQNKWFPVAVHVSIDYRKALGPGQRFVLETSLQELGARSATISQRFVAGDTLHAEARVVVVLLHRGRVIELEPLRSALPHLVPADSALKG